MIIRLFIQKLTFVLIFLLSNISTAKDNKIPNDVNYFAFFSENALQQL